MSTQGLTLDALKRRQTFLKMLLFFFVTVIAWLFFSVLHEQSAIPPDDEVKRMAEPLNPNLNLEVIHELEQKKTFSKAELDSVPDPAQAQSPTAPQPQAPSPSITPEASPVL